MPSLWQFQVQMYNEVLDGHDASILIMYKVSSGEFSS